MPEIQDQGKLKVKIVHKTFLCRAPLPDFFESADFLEPIFGGTDNPKIGKSGRVTVDLEYMYIRIYYVDLNM